MKDENIYRSDAPARLEIRVRITPETAAGTGESYETFTIDLSRRGACVVAREPIPVGAVVEFAASRFFFRTRAAVRALYRDRLTGTCVLGLEFLEAVWEPFARVGRDGVDDLPLVATWLEPAPDLEC